MGRASFSWKNHAVLKECIGCLRLTAMHTLQSMRNEGSVSFVQFANGLRLHQHDPGTEANKLSHMDSFSISERHIA